MHEKSVIIKDPHGVIKELVVFDGYNPEYAIKLGYHHYLMISRAQFDRIIYTAKANGFMVFDYTEFD